MNLSIVGTTESAHLLMERSAGMSIHGPTKNSVRAGANPALSSDCETTYSLTRRQTSRNGSAFFPSTINVPVGRCVFPS